MKFLQNFIVNYSKKMRTPYTNITAINKNLKYIPKRKGLPIIGTTLSIICHGSAPKLHLYIDKGHKLLGPIFRENMGKISAVFVSDPFLMRQVFKEEGKYPKHFLPEPWIIYNEIHACKRGLFFMDDEEWHFYRQLMNRHFLKKEVASHLNPLHQTVVQHLIKRWKRYDGKEIVNLDQELHRHSISFVLGSIMGSSYVNDLQKYDKDIERLASLFYTIFGTTAKLNGKPVKMMAKLSFSDWVKFEKAVQGSLDACHELVEKFMKNISNDSLLYKLTMENMAVNRIVAIVVDLLLAAGDTTATTNQWALYLLGTHKEVQKTILESADGVKNVIKETLRLYPPAIFISRTMPEDVNISGYTLSKGEMVLLSLYSVGRNSEIYPSPNLFKPERWARNENRRFADVIDPSAYFPFGLGARSCIGRYIALAQLQYTISEILAEYELEAHEEVDMILRLVPVPEKPIRIKIKSRNH